MGGSDGTSLRGFEPGEVCERHLVANGARPVLCSDSGVALLVTQGGRGGGGVEGCENPLLLKQNRVLKHNLLQQLTAEHVLIRAVNKTLASGCAEMSADSFSTRNGLFAA